MKILSLFNNRLYLTAVVIAALFAPSFSTKAEEPSQKDYAKSQKMIDRFDADKDGKLNDKELSAMKSKMAEMRKVKLEKFDKNKDGQLDDQEKAAMRDAKEQWQAKKADHKAKRFEKMDLNHNGALDEEEFKKVQELKANKFKALDINKDGKVDKKEWEIHKPFKE